MNLCSYCELCRETKSLKRYKLIVTSLHFMKRNHVMCLCLICKQDLERQGIKIKEVK